MISVLLTLAVLIFPGFLFLFQKHVFSSLHFVEKIPLCVTLSLAYWIIGFWWMTYIPMTLNAWIYLSVLGSIGMCIYLIRTRWQSFFRTHHPLRTTIFISLFFLILLIPQVFLITQQPVPSGQDMSMHSYIAAVITRINGFPHALSPLLPVHQFGLYPFGFSTIIAVMSTINILPVYTNALLVTALTHFLFDYALYLFLRVKFSPFISALVAFVVMWTSHNPHLFIEWGANPSVLSLTFLLLGIATILQSKNRHGIVLATIFAVASFLTNYMFIIALGYILIFLGLFTIPYRHTQIFVSGKKIAFAFFVGIFLLSPLLTTYVSFRGFTLTEPVRQFIQGLHLDETHLWNGTLTLQGIWGLTEVLSETIDHKLIVAYGIALCFLFPKRKWHVYKHGVVISAVYLLVANARFWWLPFSSALYPQRIALLLLIPIAWALARSLTEIRIARPRIFVSLTLVCILFFGVQLRQDQFLRASYDHQLVTHNDLAVLTWLQRNSSQRDVIWNRYEDAGVWIPAIIYRPITLYHTNPVDMDSIQRAPKQKPDFAFIGEASAQEQPIDTLVRETNEQAKDWNFTLLYSQGGASVYRITQK